MPIVEGRLGRDALLRLSCLVAGALLCAVPALAADRAISVTDYDNVRVAGSYNVAISTGKAATARVSGSTRAIEGVRVAVENRTLVIRPVSSLSGTGWDQASAGPVTVALSTQVLRAVSISGSATVGIDRMRAPKVEIGLGGSGGVTVARIEADDLVLTLVGSGNIGVAGKAANARATMRGSGNIDASALIGSDVRIDSSGSGEVRIGAIRSANIVASGSGGVAISGSPACTVKSMGAGKVVCGR